MFALLGVLAGGVIADELGGLQQLHGKAGQHVSKQDPQKLNQLPESVRSSELIARTDRGLRLTAAVYVCHGAARHLRQTGRLPDAIGGPWSVIPMRHVIEERGIDFELTEDEELVYDAIIREGRLPGGAVRLVDPDGEAPSGGSSGELQKVIAESSGALDDRSVEFVTLLRHSGILGDEDWSQIIEELRDALRFLARPNRTVARDAEAHLVIDLDADPRNADWLRSASANRLAGHHLPLWSSLWLCGSATIEHLLSGPRSGPLHETSVVSRSHHRRPQRRSRDDVQDSLRSTYRELLEHLSSGETMKRLWRVAT